jgi:hypothetical protein
MQKPRPVQGIAATEALAALGYTARQGDGDMKDTKPNDPPFDVRALESIERASSGLKLRPEQVAALREGYCTTGAQGYTSFGARSAIPAHVAHQTSADPADDFRAIMENVEGHPYYSLEETARNGRILAALARDADVRTLDDWVIYLPALHSYALDGGSFILMIANRHHKFQGATPDEARAKAAAWVRSTTCDSP